jgi:hypothetical protein
MTFFPTGHYARTSYGEDLELKPWKESEFYGKKRVKLLKAIDRIKDQTFFLSQARPLKISIRLYIIPFFFHRQDHSKFRFVYTLYIFSFIGEAIHYFDLLDIITTKSVVLYIHGHAE